MWYNNDMNSLAITMLNAIAGLLMALHASNASPAALQTGLTLAENGMQLATQASANVPFVVPQNNSIWPNITDLVNAAYRDSNGNWVALGSTVTLIESYTSFGDLNHDGIDDAAVIVSKPDASGGQHYFLVAMLNQGGVMFDVAEFPLGNTLNVTTHSVTPAGTIMLNNTQYALFGTSLSEI